MSLQLWDEKLLEHNSPAPDSAPNAWCVRAAPGWGAEEWRPKRYARYSRQSNKATAPPHMNPMLRELGILLTLRLGPD